MNSYILLFVGIIGATLTFFISERMKLGAVKASALPSLLVGLFFYWSPDVFNAYLTEHIPIVFVGTSFIGMVSSKAVKSYALLAISGGIFAIIYIKTNYIFKGYGGALGALAFTALLASMVLRTAISKRATLTNRWSTLKKLSFNRKK
ncbi:hypothetical protein [Allomuricauda sp. F6463D]|uniref:hypothetical protein n=1 Tax=Allomuricauda sp. F6463D TaxID=2926409 RepID=UPI001FF1110B|nr:hypothetical protein [Muricauda sp. F6463D]MCK0159147.1 hypothetical protein [Muricauda sp. F6463D]